MYSDKNDQTVSYKCTHTHTHPFNIIKLEQTFKNKQLKKREREKRIHQKMVNIKSVVVCGNQLTEAATKKNAIAYTFDSNEHCIKLKRQHVHQVQTNNSNEYNVNIQ